MYLIGVDIGGTNLKLGLIKNKKIICKQSVPTDPQNVILQTVELINQIISANNLTAKDITLIGVGVPGIVSAGYVYSCVNIEISNCNLQKILTKKLGIKTIVKNDVDMSAMAEKTLGYGKNIDNFCMLSFGTGVGGSIVANGKIIENGAGEFGHTVLYKDGIKCNCGRRGCAEKYVSAKVLVNACEKVLKENGRVDKINVGDIDKMYKNKDKLVYPVIKNYMSDLVEFLLNICNSLRPECIFISGGLAFAPEILKDVADLCKKMNFGYKNAPVTHIKIAKLGYDAGILGVLSVL